MDLLYHVLVQLEEKISAGTNLITEVGDLPTERGEDPASIIFVGRIP